MKKVVFFTVFFVFLQMFASEKSLLILTTDKIVESSKVLKIFIEQKKERGFKVFLATEKNYGKTTLKGQEKAIYLRNWLKNNAQSYKFLLIIGNPHPKYGDIPMFIVWPRYDFPKNQCLGFFVDCRSLETDMMYSNLSGNWDLNNDGKFGEFNLDFKEGGVDFTPEKIVGRIPVYFQDTSQLDKILQNAIDYENQAASEIKYRKKILFPASFFYFKGEKMADYTVERDVDGAETSQWTIKNILLKNKDFSYTRMYEDEGIVKTKYDFDIALTKENLENEWEKGYGIVWWFGHGFKKKVVRTIWKNDQNHNNIPDEDEIEHPVLIDDNFLNNFNSKKPAFVITTSCNIGSVETPQNIAFEMLLKGNAIGIIASSSLTPLGFDTSKIDATIDKTVFGATNLGVELIKQMIKGEIPSEILAKSKIKQGTSNNQESVAGKMMLNYFGDPTLFLFSTKLKIEKQSQNAGCSLIHF